MPGTEVGIERNGPPVVCRAWGPRSPADWRRPASWSRITRLSARGFQLRSQRRGLEDVDAVMSAANAFAAAAIVPRNLSAIEGVIGRAAE